MKRLTFACILALATLLFINCHKNDDNTLPVDVKPVTINFAIADTGIHVNPNGYTPLSAQINFNSVKSGRTFIKVHGRHGTLSDVAHLFNDTGTNHSIPVIGMYADTTNTVDIRIVDANGDTLAQSTFSIITQALPQNLPTSIVTNALNESQVSPGMYLVSSLSSYGNTQDQPFSIPYILDDYGDIRWVLDYTTNTDLKSLYSDCGIARLKNGNFYFANSATNQIYETDVLGNIINQWSMPGYGFHHEVHEETNGNFLVTANKDGTTFTNGNPTEEDYVIEIDRNSKQIITEWDLRESLQEYRRTWGRGVSEGDWFHGNAVLEDTTDNTIIVSGRNQGVVKLDRSNNVKWILAPHKGWGFNRRGEDLKQFLLTPVDASGNPYADTNVAYGSSIQPDFEWNCYQHCPIFLPDGNIMIFDNGTNRTLDSVDGNIIYNAVAGKYSRAVEYKINTANMTVQQVWEYGKERDIEGYSAIISSVQFLAGSNHVVFAPGFNVQNAEGHGGKIVEVNYATGQVVNEISVSTASTFSAHRAKKINLYPDNL